MRWTGRAVLVMSHLGRPKEGVFDARCRWHRWPKRCPGCSAAECRWCADWLDGVEVAEPGEVVLCENVRFNKRREEADDEALARRMAALCDVFVMDAFGTAHRAQARPTASRERARRLRRAAAAAELDALGARWNAPARPLVAIVGGSKVSTKLTVLESLWGRRPADRRRRDRQHLHRGRRATTSASRCTSRPVDDGRTHGRSPRRAAATSRCRSMWSWRASSPPGAGRRVQGGRGRRRTR
jgi:hypothetical protein